MRAVALILCLVASPAWAKPWNSIEPGVSKKEEVVTRFGEPSKSVTLEGKEVLAYLGAKAIKGTTQAQFRVDPTSRVVERIDIFPGPVIERETVENNYGPVCPAQGPLPASPCFIKKLAEDFRTYYYYPRLGLAIFFNEDGKTVQSLTFKPAENTRG